MDKIRAYKRRLPPIEEDERIYFDIPYVINGLARVTNCGYDPDRQLWFTGCNNAHIDILVKTYGINENTSDKAKKLLEEKLKQKGQT